MSTELGNCVTHRDILTEFGNVRDNQMTDNI